MFHVLRADYSTTRAMLMVCEGPPAESAAVSVMTLLPGAASVLLPDEEGELPQAVSPAAAVSSTSNTNHCSAFRYFTILLRRNAISKPQRPREDKKGPANVI